MLSSEAICIAVPAIIKARVVKGKRTVWVEASNQKPDSEGDVILQSALLNSADSFLRNGHIDIDHLSEIGDRLSPPVNKADFVIGYPLEVNDAGEGRTGVLWELNNSAAAEKFWESLISGQGKPWKASIYGFPTATGLKECQRQTCDYGATRYLVSGIDWRSLAMTQNPVNDAIEGVARVITAKALIKSITKNSREISKIAHAGANLPDTIMAVDNLMTGDPEQRTMSPDELNSIGNSLPVIAMSEERISLCSREGLIQDYREHVVTGQCTETDMGLSVATLRDHYMRCHGMDFHKADILALAMIHLLNRGIA